MWILTNNAFVSIVEHRDDPDMLVVRGRHAGDVARFLGVLKALEQVTPDADYRFRIVAKRDAVEKALVRAVRDVTYPNFKNSIRESWRHTIANRIWAIFFDHQSRTYPRRHDPSLFDDEGAARG